MLINYTDDCTLQNMQVEVKNRQYIIGMTYYVVFFIVIKIKFIEWWKYVFITISGFEFLKKLKLM